MSNLNDWLIAYDIFFVIRCIILLSNNTENKIKWCTYLFIRSVVQWHEACVEPYIIDTSEMRTPQFHCYNHYAPYVEFC